MTRLLWSAGIVVWCALIGVVGGWVWASRWTAPTGVVAAHVWYPDPWDSGSRAAFAATASYTVIALILGTLIGLLAAWCSRAGELLTIGAVLAGTCLAAWLMYHHGVSSAPPDPTAAAKKAADGTRMLGTMAPPGWSARACLPLAASLALGAWFLLVSPGNSRRQAVGSDPA
ncbi:MAG: hypothetical protein QM572_05005 [Nocardioides sp.]|uniref:hypothetical protein n=1 Tax=Nocardioides sp. TaxID=35761 RepID=UPI0039E62D5D